VSTAFNLSDPRGSIDIAHELMALAFQCDATRVLSFQWGNSTTNRPHTMIQASGGHHDTSHHGMDATMIAKIRRIDYWWFRRFTALLTRLQGMTDIDGRTVLDNTLIFQSSDVSDGAMHNHNDMPVVLAGGAAGFRLGQHIDVTPPGSNTGTGGGNGSNSTTTFTGSWFGDLYLAIGKGFGLNLASFGEHSSNPIPGLT
jgi:hypothetical protein